MKASRPEHPGLKTRVLIFIPAYQAEGTIAGVIARIPESLHETYDLDVLIADDSSRDLTFVRCQHARQAEGSRFHMTVLYNPVNLGYGGNQKIGYRYAIENGYDLVAMLHGDGQYAPEYLPFLLEPFAQADVAAVFGSRMLTRGSALRGGMPIYKFLGNKVLTWLQNRILGSDLSEFHSGYRIYSTAALRLLPYERNSNGFHFDTEIIIQLLTARLRILERPVPTFYGSEICRVDGVRYARDVIRATVKSRLQKLGILYDPRFDCAPRTAFAQGSRLDYSTPQSMARERIPPGARVLEFGCGKTKSNEREEPKPDCAAAGSASGRHDVVLCLDVIEHLRSPESFLCGLRDSLAGAKLLISTANVAFIIPRLMLLIGQFNYGRRGILDLTHTRLFTFSSFRRCLEQSGFEVTEMAGVPAPFPVALGDNLVSRALVKLNQWLIGVSRGLFAYQIFASARPLPTVKSLLDAAMKESEAKLHEFQAIAEVEHRL